MNTVVTVRPAPWAHEWLPDLLWFEANRSEPEVRAHRGRYVAVLGARVVAAGDDRAGLERACARAFGVHPGRVVVEWVA